MITADEAELIHKYPDEVQKAALLLWQTFFPAKSLNLYGLIHLFAVARSVDWLQGHVDEFGETQL